MQQVFGARPPAVLEHGLEGGQDPIDHDIGIAALGIKRIEPEWVRVSSIENRDTVGALRRYAVEDEVDELPLRINHHHGSSGLDVSEDQLPEHHRLPRAGRPGQDEMLQTGTWSNADGPLIPCCGRNPKDVFGSAECCRCRWSTRVQSGKSRQVALTDRPAQEWGELRRAQG